MTVPYFAYGSNLGQSALRERCPSARQLGVARVEGFRLGFTRRSEKRRGGVADLVPAPGSVV
ncbi:MAG: gamma-glutamylcyclotransferase, partial [Sorangiineae bacterium PRO1]|nr:gamma-glutamylcyclotransferase [Sorangiineae bacterium PRO1]